jgi:hypothetical protein
LQITYSVLEGVSKMLEQISEVGSPHQNKEKGSYQYMSAVLGVESSCSPDFSPLVFIFGSLKKTSVFLSPIEHEETLHHRMCDACQAIPIAPRPLQGCDIP